MDEVIKQYPTGVKYVFKQMPLTQIHPFAMPAAKASIAAQKQGKFWEYHDVLFKNRRQLKAENLTQYAEELGLDTEQLKKDMNSPETQNQINQDMKLARASGVRGTPTVFVGGKRLQNRSVEGFKAMIDPLLKK